jgi:hypothetical protein
MGIDMGVVKRKASAPCDISRREVDEREGYDIRDRRLAPLMRMLAVKQNKVPEALEPLL